MDAAAIAAWNATTGSAGTRLAALQAVVVVEPNLGPIPAREIKKLWSRWMVLARCRLYVADNAPAVLGERYTDQIAALRVVCQAAADSLQGDVFDDLNPADPVAEADMKHFLGALQAAGALTAQQVSSTWALGVREARPFAAIGLPDLHAAGLITAGDAGVGNSA